MKTIIMKFNNGFGAICCSQCNTVIKTGSNFTEDESRAMRGEIELPAQYCIKHDGLHKEIKLIKLSDDEFEGNHPNGIYAGYTTTGYIKDLPKIGERFFVLGNTFSTSIVTKELDKNNVFKTLYSTYKIEYL